MFEKTTAFGGMVEELEIMIEKVLEDVRSMCGSDGLTLPMGRNAKV